MCGEGRCVVLIRLTCIWSEHGMPVHPSCGDTPLSLSGSLLKPSIRPASGRRADPKPHAHTSRVLRPRVLQAKTQPSVGEDRWRRWESTPLQKSSLELEHSRILKSSLLSYHQGTSLPLAQPCALSFAERYTSIYPAGKLICE